jgi:hypothetical protein
MPTFTVPHADSLENTVAELIKRIEWIMAKLDSKNVKKLDTNETVIKSADGTTQIVGPVLVMKDNLGQTRLRQGYDAATLLFLFQLLNASGDVTVSIDSNGDLVVERGTFKGSISVGTNYKVKIYENTLNGIIQFLDENNVSAGSISYNGTGVLIDAVVTLFLDGYDIYLEAGNDVTVTTGRYFNVNYPDIQLTTTTGKARYSSGGGASSEIATQAWVNSQGYITGVSGANGVFTTADGKTVTVSDGLITSIT